MQKHKHTHATQTKGLLDTFDIHNQCACFDGDHFYATRACVQANEDKVLRVNESGILNPVFEALRLYRLSKRLRLPAEKSGKQLYIDCLGSRGEFESKIIQSVEMKYDKPREITDFYFN